MIFILTGAIGSGKTTKLKEWIDNKGNIGGILMPVVDGVRCIYSIDSGESFPVESGEDVSDEDVIVIGKYRFSRRIFQWGNDKILKSFKQNDTVVIDEIGPLELNNSGFYPSLKIILRNRDKLDTKTIIMVAREGLVQSITVYFNLNGFEIIEDLSEINNNIIRGL